MCSEIQLNTPLAPECHIHSGGCGWWMAKTVWSDSDRLTRDCPGPGPGQQVAVTRLSSHWHGDRDRHCDCDSHSASDSGCVTKSVIEGRKALTLGPGATRNRGVTCKFGRDIPA
eukprot:42883-Rhodomonas_salina.1